MEGIDVAIESDVLVIGGGLAGLTSALAAADAGVDVRLVSHKQSTLRNASGLIDILGYTPDGEGPITNPYERIPTLPAEHPYRTVGIETVRAAMELFDTAVPYYHGNHTDRNALLPTHGGTIKPTARYPAGARAGLATDDRDVLLVGLESMVDFDAGHIAAHLEATGVPFEVRGATIRFPGDRAEKGMLTRYAKLLDANSDIEDGGRTKPVRAALADRVATHLEDEQRVGFPAFLGNVKTAAIRSTMSEHLGVDVFEVPMGPPSLPGLRLEDALFDALDEYNASIETGNPVTDYEGEDHIERVFIEKNGAKIPNRADQYILATGGLVGKGVESNRDGVFEPIFDCHVPHPGDRYDWFDGTAFGDHQFAHFGVTTDEALRPVDENETAEFDNLRAAGSVLGGYNFAAEKSGGGVSIATGYDAGQRAAQEAR